MRHCICHDVRFIAVVITRGDLAEGMTERMAGKMEGGVERQRLGLSQAVVLLIQLLPLL